MAFDPNGLQIKDASGSLPQNPGYGITNFLNHAGFDVSKASGGNGPMSGGLPANNLQALTNATPAGYTTDKNGNIVPEARPGVASNNTAAGISRQNLQSIFGTPQQMGQGGGAYSQYAGFGQDQAGYINTPQGFQNLLKNQNAVAGGDLSGFQKSNFQSAYLADPNTMMMDPSKQYFGGDPRFAMNQFDAMQAQAAAAQGRAAPTINTGGMAPWQAGAQQALANMNQANAGLQLGANNLNAQGFALNNAATGAGYQGQLQAAQGLQQLSLMPAGPSVAEQAMRMQSAQNERTQAALAAGARGGNSALALNNAAANAASVGGNLQQQLGVQRAQEDMANRQFAANALGAAGGMYGNAAQTQLGAYGGAANAYGAGANAYNAMGGISGQQAGLNLQGSQQMGNIATQNAANQLGQTQLNQQYGLGSQQLGQQYMTSQLNASNQAEANRTQNLVNLKTNQFANRDRSGEGTITGSGGGDKLLGAGASALSLLALSDINAKKDVKPATADVSNAFRTMGSDLGNTATPTAIQPNYRTTGGTFEPIAPKQVYDPNEGLSRSYQFGLGANPYTDATLQPTIGDIGAPSYYATSDIRAKKDIHPAQAAIDEAYRQGAALRAPNGMISPMSVGRMPDVVAPAYSYEYKNPGALGATGGVHYGPMAQDLEKTPAGRSVVVTKPNGMKGIDTSRLSLLNTSELAKQRAELDALKQLTAYNNSAPQAISSPVVQYPQPVMGMY